MVQQLGATILEVDSLLLDESGAGQLVRVLHHKSVVCREHLKTTCHHDALHRLSCPFRSLGVALLASQTSLAAPHMLV